MSFRLVHTSYGMGLQSSDDPDSPLFYIDFLARSLLYRIHPKRLPKELLIRALGQKPSHHSNLIIDATAGLGRDSFILAAMGYQVIMLECSPIVCSLLSDAIKRASQHTTIRSIMHRIQLIQTDAICWLRAVARSIEPVIIYLDPMFPARKKSALVKKNMQILKALLNSPYMADIEQSSTNLLKTALCHASYRVIVKRPRNALPLFLDHYKPNFSLCGKTSRFDIYLPYFKG